MNAHGSEFRQRIVNGPCLLLDGGLGSMLIARGLPAGSPPDLWNLERPDDVRDVHRLYVEAGSEAVHSNTFGANPTRLARFGIEDRMAEINRAGVRLARESGACLVIGDMGPTGEYLPPVGNGNPEAWQDGFRLQARILAEAGADALHVETLSDLREALLALHTVTEAVPGLPVLISLTFDSKKRGFFTVMGDPLLESLRALRDAGASAVGANCTLESREMRELAALVRDRSELRLVLQPNAGQPRIENGAVVYDCDPGGFARDMAPLAGQEGMPRGAAAAPEATPGARLPVALALGGCCGTDPRFIAELRAHLGSRA